MLDEAPDLRVSDYARQALEGTETRQQAASRLLEMAHENPDLYRALMSPMEQTAALRAVNGVVGAERKTVWSAPQRAAQASAQAQAPERLRNAARVNFHTLLDFKLPGTNIALRDAKRADLIEAAKFYRSRADDALSEFEIERLQAETASTQDT